ncbi:CD59 glycoprotein isoform 1-T2 [Mantella aurantiaca]
MNSTAACRLALPLGLLLLVFCSTGLALQCYNCGLTAGKCTDMQTCASGDNACMKATQTDLGSSVYACRDYNRCKAQDVISDYQLASSISVSCCQSNLCNKGITGLPASGLILFLAAALLVLFS